MLLLHTASHRECHKVQPKRLETILTLYETFRVQLPTEEFSWDGILSQVAEVTN